MALVVLNVIIVSFGLTTFGAVKEEIQPRWSYLSTCSYLFEKDTELPDYDILACGGETTVPGGKYAYVKVELQYLVNGNWENFGTWEDEDYICANVEKYIIVTPGYTYKLKLTHKAKNANGTVLETFNDESDYYITSLPRT